MNNDLRRIQEILKQWVIDNPSSIENEGQKLTVYLTVENKAKGSYTLVTPNFSPTWMDSNSKSKGDLKDKDTTMYLIEMYSTGTYMKIIGIENITYKTELQKKFIPVSKKSILTKIKSWF